MFQVVLTNPDGNDMLVNKLCATAAPTDQRAASSQGPAWTLPLRLTRFLLNRIAIATVLSSVAPCFSQSVDNSSLKPIPQMELNFLKNAEPGSSESINLWRPASPRPQSPAISQPPSTVDFNQPSAGQNVTGFQGTPTLSSNPVPAAGTMESWAREIVAEGSQYASQDRWSEALALYQKALREHPENRLILEHRQLARIQVDLRQRLADRKYLHYAISDSPEYAMSSYNEILSKIQAFHVDEPNWDGIAKHGLNALLTAFENPEFQQKLGNEEFTHTQKATAEILRDNLATFEINSRLSLLNLVRDVAQLVEDKSSLPRSVTIHEFASSAISALDTYSGYLSPGHFEDVTSQIRGNFVGIGVELKANRDALDIVRVIPGGPADQARIRAGDKLLAVNGQQVSEIGGDEAADLLKGTEGSELTVVVQTPEDKQYRLRIVRRQIDIPSIEKAELVDANRGIAYIKLANFQKNTLSEFDYAMQMLAARGMKALVLDLRENPGGVLDVSVAIANRFLTGGVIVETKGRNPLENAVHPASVQNTWSLPLVVLVNEHSASASEILAAAIKDHQRGTVVGQKSFGKGSVQGIFPLSSGRGGIRLTTAKFYSPKGIEIHQHGVHPDFTVQQSAKPGSDSTVHVGTEEAEEDLTLSAALKIAGNKLTPTASIHASAR